MLFNPKWVKDDAFELPTLIKWLERRDPKAMYIYKNCHDCLLGQYFLAQGFDNPVISRTSLIHGLKVGPFIVKGGMEQLPPFFDWIARGNGATYDHTFGAALERAKLARDDRMEAIGEAMRCSW